MMRFMRTTVTFHSNLEQLLRETAARTRRPFKKILNETLRGARSACASAWTPRVSTG